MDKTVIGSHLKLHYNLLFPESFRNVHFHRGELGSFQSYFFFDNDYITVTV